MALQRSRRKRRLARLRAAALLATLAALAGLALTGCTDTRTNGWSDPESGARVSSFDLDAATGTISVNVELPPGYEAADDFVQRATLRSSDGERTDSQSGLDRAFRLERPSDDASDVTLELVLGFCKSDVKEICYVDTPTLALRWRADRASQAATRTLVYRPEARE